MITPNVDSNVYDHNVIKPEIKLKLKQIKTKDEDDVQQIPLKIPYYFDPRKMNRNQLLSELRNKKLNPNGHRSILVARLLQSMVEEGLKNIPNPILMDDRQPEKWMLIANQNFDAACELESDPYEREKCMGLANLRLAELTKSREGLIAIATGVEIFEMQSALYHHLIRFGAALMLEPIVEQEAKGIAVTSSSSNIIRSSITIFNMCTGFEGIPDYLSEEGAIEHLKLNNEKSNKRKYGVVINNVKVEINGEISIDVNGRQVKSRVTNILSDYDENGDLRREIIAKPVNVFEGGKLSSFKLSFEEYEDAKSHPLFLNDNDE